MGAVLYFIYENGFYTGTAFCILLFAIALEDAPPADDIYAGAAAGATGARGEGTGAALCRALVRMYDTARLRCVSSVTVSAACATTSTTGENAALIILTQRNTVSTALQALLATSIMAKEAALQSKWAS